MAVTLRADAAYKNRWLVSKSAESEPLLGAQLTDPPETYLTIYWSGHPKRADLFEIIFRFTDAFAYNRFRPLGRLIAYGQDMRAEFELLEPHKFTPLPEKSFVKDAKREPLESFDACRAELSTRDGLVIVWANVTGVRRKGLEQGGENIGITTSSKMFYGPVRPVIEKAITMTSDLESETIELLLNKFSRDWMQKQRPAAD